MNSKNDEYVERNDDHEDDLPDEPKTPHEEVMFVVESTNNITSDNALIVARISQVVKENREIVSEHTKRLDAIAELLKLILAREQELLSRP